MSTKAMKALMKDMERDIPDMSIETLFELFFFANTLKKKYPTEYMIIMNLAAERNFELLRASRTNDKDGGRDEPR